MADAATRTEPATPARLEAARRDGRVVVSAEIAPLVVLAAALAAGSAGAALFVERASLVLRQWLAAAGPLAASGDSVRPLAWRTAEALAVPVGGLLLIVAAAGGGAVAAQVGWHPSPGRVVPDPKRLGAGWARLASAEGAASLVRAIAKIGLVLAVAWRALAAVGTRALDAAALAPADVLALAGHGIRDLGVALAAALVVVAAADYAWARWRNERDLKTSRSELRAERREREGDPQLRGRFRRAHREVAKRGGPGDLRRADVVLADPGIAAVALRYRPDEARAPRVVASGGGAVAERMAARARTAGVPIVERRALARTILRSIAIGGEIPPALYRGVAEALAFAGSPARPHEDDREAGSARP